MPRIARVLTALAMSLAPIAVGTLTPISAEAAGPAVKIYYVKFDSTGTDNYTNASINNEDVVLKNMTSVPQTLTRWTVRDKAGFTYTFPTFVLGKGASVAIRPGKGIANQTQRYYNKTSYVWDNTGDTAYLRNAAGVLIHSCAAVGKLRYC